MLHKSFDNQIQLRVDRAETLDSFFNLVGGHGRKERQRDRAFRELSAFYKRVNSRIAKRAEVRDAWVV